MSFDFAGDGGYALRGRPGALRLEPDGIRHPTSPSGRGSAFTAYREVDHVATSPRALWLGTRRSVYVLGRPAFARSDGPEQFARALLDRLAEVPGGRARLAHLAAVEQIARRAAPARATWGLVLLCLLVFAVQLAFGPVVDKVGYFSAALVLDGDLWRVVTANLIHGVPQLPVHLVLNLLGLVIVGTLLERGLGAACTIFVMGVSGLAAMLACGLAGQAPVVGVSGVVFGLLGGVMWLELRCTRWLPAWWRLPRRTLWILLGVNVALPFLVPVISGAAHMGGLAAGFGATALATGRSLRPQASPAWARAAAALVAGIGLASVAGAVSKVAADDNFLLSHSLRLAALPGADPEELNEAAWRTAIEPEATDSEVRVALDLAERAVRKTARSKAHILDTLAEVQFRLGQHDSAIATIDEAIALEPREPYYREQRRRFTGERAADDRPPDPGLGIWPRRLPEPETPPPDSGITV